MARTKPEDVEQICRQAYDDQYYASRRWLTRFMLGEKLSSGTVTSSVTGEMPDDIDLLPRYYEPGQSRRILVNQAIMASMITYMEPAPEYPDKPKYKEIVTQAFNRVLWKGRPHMGPTKHSEYGEWQAECQRAFMDFDGLGVGFVQIGVRDGWTCLQHHPLSRVLWDRHRLGISRSRFIAFMHYLAEEEAVAMFGSKLKKEAVTTNSSGQQMRVVKALQYFDMGLGRGTPTEMWRLNGFAGEVIDVSENEFECLPVAHGEHMHLPGMRRPMGRADFQVADQVLRNAYERYQRLVLERGPGFDAVRQDGVDPDDLAALEEGELLAMIRLTGGAGESPSNVIQRYPAQEVPASLYQGLMYLDRNDPGNSGLSDANRANVTSSPRTLGELEMAQQGADAQKAWSQRQYAMFLARVFHKANFIAAKHHTAPTPVSINGVPYLLNEPGVPQSNLSYWLAPHSWPVINEDALLKQSPLRKMQVAQGKWLPLMADPGLNPVEVRKAFLEEMGIKDVDKFLASPEQMMAQQGIDPAQQLTADSAAQI